MGNYTVNLMDVRVAWRRGENFFPGWLELSEFPAISTESRWRWWSWTGCLIFWVAVSTCWRS